MCKATAEEDEINVPITLSVFKDKKPRRIRREDLRSLENVAHCLLIGLDLTGSTGMGGWGVGGGAILS